MQTFSCLCEDLGVPLALNKSFGPTHVLVFLCLEIDTLENVHQNKIQILTELLLSYLDHKSITLKRASVFSRFSEYLR